MKNGFLKCEKKNIAAKIKKNQVNWKIITYGSDLFFFLFASSKIISVARLCKDFFHRQ